MIIEIKNLSKTFKKNTIQVLNDVNYKFKKGTIYCISGRSGAGKSTLVQILGLLSKPTKGKVLINGQDTSTLNDDEKSELRNQTIGFVFQSFYLDKMLKAYENVMLPMYLCNKDKNIMKEKTLKLLETVELENRANHFPSELSGGEQQRVAIARALANEPEIILADEPTGSLDPENEKNILKILKKLADKGKCVIIVSHSQEVQKYADKILKIDKQKIVEVKNEE